MHLLYGLLTRYRESARISQNASVESEIIIAVMGQTGSGKSRFIKQITGSDEITVGHGLHSGQSASTDRNVCLLLKYYRNPAC
jgi:ABC-type lipoprotein export system ATPase subunit